MHVCLIPEGTEASEDKVFVNETHAERLYDILYRIGRQKLFLAILQRTPSIILDLAENLFFMM